MANTKRKTKKQSRASRILSWLKPDTNAKRIVIFVVVFAMAGSGYYLYKSLAANTQAYDVTISGHNLVTYNGATKGQDCDGKYNGVRLGYCMDVIKMSAWGEAYGIFHTNFTTPQYLRFCAYARAQVPPSGTVPPQIDFYNIHVGTTNYQKLSTDQNYHYFCFTETVPAGSRTVQPTVENPPQDWATPSQIYLRSISIKTDYRLDLFVRGEGDKLYHKWYDTGWSGWEAPGGNFAMASSPAVASWGPGRLDIFARGANGHLWHMYYSGQWHGWEDLGGQITSAPAAVSWTAGRIDVVARGTDGALWHIYYSSRWSAWESLGGGVQSSPAIASWGPGRLDVFVRGNDNQIYTRWYSGGWSQWTLVAGGGTTNDSPAVTSWWPGRIDLFVRGTDNHLYQNYFSNGWQSRYTALGGTLTSAPTAASWGPGRLDVFVRGAANVTYHKWYDGKWSGWESQGGSASSAPTAVSWN